jgi:hypothetical protein
LRAAIAAANSLSPFETGDDARKARFRHARIRVVDDRALDGTIAGLQQNVRDGVAELRPSRDFSQ